MKISFGFSLHLILKFLIKIINLKCCKKIIYQNFGLIKNIF